MCGILGFCNTNNNNFLSLFYNKLCLLQSRGQDGIGIVTVDNTIFNEFKGLGLIHQVLTKSIIQSIKGKYAIAHNRYTTTGKSDNLTSIQPIEVKLKSQTIYFAHNGTIVNFKGKNGESDYIFIKQKLIEFSKNSNTIDDILIQFMNNIQGAYSLLILTNDGIYGMRDRFGFRPMSLGKVENNLFISSESCIFNDSQSEYFREVQPGEIIKITNGRIKTLYQYNKTIPKFCSFEYVYFSRPDSLLNNKSLYEVRVNLGRQLAREDDSYLGGKFQKNSRSCELSKREVDFVTCIPNSSIPHTIGYSLESGIPLHHCIIRNSYIGRTFILPDDASRKDTIALKFNCIPSIIKDKSIIIIDDSIVRGHTIKSLIQLLRKNGAREVHIRIASPPIKYPCFMGIDMSTDEELIAHEKNTDQICNIIGADSLKYLSLDGMKSVISDGKNNICTACFSGQYPIGLDW